MDDKTQEQEKKIQTESLVIPIIGFTVAEVAAALRIHERSVLRLIADAGLPARKVAGGWRIEQEALRRWLAAGCDKPMKYNIKKNQNPEPEPELKPVMPMRPKTQPRKTEPEPKSEPIITMRRGKPKQKT